jgi:hypothetical protein
MSGSISNGPLVSLVSHAAPPLQSSPRPDPPAGGLVFQSVMTAGSPAPRVVVPPSPCENPFGQALLAPLLPAASGLQGKPGPQAVGLALARADLSMAAWPAAAGTASACAAAAPDLVQALSPAIRSSAPVSHHLSSFV